MGIEKTERFSQLLSVEMLNVGTRLLSHPILKLFLIDAIFLI